METHPASKGPVVACRGKMWQEVAQTKKSRGMVAISSKDVKDCERIVEEVELCRRVTPAAPIPVLCPTEQQCYGAGGGLDPSIL